MLISNLITNVARSLFASGLLVGLALLPTSTSGQDSTNAPAEFGKHGNVAFNFNDTGGVVSNETKEVVERPQFEVAQASYVVPVRTPTVPPPHQPPQNHIQQIPTQPQQPFADPRFNNRVAPPQAQTFQQPNYNPNFNSAGFRNVASPSYPPNTNPGLTPPPIGTRYPQNGQPGAAVGHPHFAHEVAPEFPPQEFHANQLPPQNFSAPAEPYVAPAPVDASVQYPILTNETFLNELYANQSQTPSAATLNESCNDGQGDEWCPSTFGLTLDTPYTYPMLDFQNRQGDKELFILNRSLTNGGKAKFTVGAQFRASGLVARTNRNDKFSYLGRFPTDFTGEYASDFRLLQANQNLTVDVNSMVHGYVETLFSDVFSFGDFKQGSFQVRQAYVVIGDLAKSPVYGFIGKKNTSFGDMGTLSPFTQAMPWHYFAPLAEGAGIGYDNGNFNATVTALNGSRGIRVVDSENPGDINNFAVNFLYRNQIDENTRFQFGAGYLDGTIYNANVAEHIDASLFGPNNGAYDINAELHSGRFHFAGEYVQTVDPWPVTDHEITAYKTEAAMDMGFYGKPARASISWSEGIQGAEGTEFEYNRQLVLGFRVQPSYNTMFSLEYVRSTGFAPLINITRVSDIEVEQDSIVFGGVIAL